MSDTFVIWLCLFIVSVLTNLLVIALILFNDKSNVRTGITEGWDKKQWLTFLLLIMITIVVPILGNLAISVLVPLKVLGKNV